MEYIDLKEYVKGVLPNEWYPTWNEEALKAGAVAVRNYALSKVQSGVLWDCHWSQVYDPSKRTEATDKAVDAVWDYVIMDGQNIVRTYYNADMAGCSMQGDNCMGQFESQADALEGMTFDEILLKYYSGKLINLPEWCDRRFGD